MDVFLSYSRADEGVAREIKEALAVEGIKVLLDVDELRGSDPWRERLGVLMKNCLGMALLATKRSEGSREVQFEVGVASGLGKPIIPLVYEDCELPAGLESLHSHNVRDIKNVCWRRIADDLLAVILIIELKRRLLKSLDYDLVQAQIDESYTHDVLDRLAALDRRLERGTYNEFDRRTGLGIGRIMDRRYPEIRLV